MPCTVLDSSDVSPGTPSPFPGIGSFAPQLPGLNLPLTPVSLPDLSGLYDVLSLILPPGIIRPSFEPDYLNDLYGGINDILSKFMPFLMLYKFFLPVLNLILCIIEVLCALMNPFSLISAIRKLFRTCIPEFLSLFPFLALIIMIISLILLIITLIAYLLERILAMIAIILENIEILSMSASRLDNDSIIAIVKKIGDLLCSLQNLFVIFGVITLIIQLIKAMLSLTFSIPPCEDGDNSGCCNPEVCPSFIKNNSDINSSTGSFLYLNEVGRDSGLTLPAFFPPIMSDLRSESWQFYDGYLPQSKAFSNIVAAFDLPPGVSKIFFPSGLSFNENSNPNLAPYTINFRFFYNPASFAFNPSDPKGPRYMRISKAIVAAPPTLGTTSYNNSVISPFNGTLNLIGGMITEDNGTILQDSNGNSISINKFIHQIPTTIPSTSPPFFPNDGYLFSNVSYDFTINHEVLLGASLITLGCIPEVAVDKNFINTTIGGQFNNNGIALGNVVGLLPDTNAAQNCIADALSTYKANISPASTVAFRIAITDCLNNLNNQSKTALAAVIAAGFDQYKSNFILDTNIQFTTLPIKVSVSLNESSGQSMTANLPSSVADSIGSKLTGNATFGVLSQFSYDGYNLFTANITSKVAGNGTIKVAFDNKYISILDNPSDISLSPSVSIKELSYTFVESPSFAGTGEPRRDETDIANAGGNN